MFPKVARQKLVGGSHSQAVPASAIASVVLGLGKIPVPSPYRLHLWALSAYMYPTVAGDSGHLVLVGGSFGLDLYAGHEEYITSFAVVPENPPLPPATLYISGTGIAVGRTAGGDDPLIEIQGGLEAMVGSGYSINMVEFSAALAVQNTDAANARSISLDLVALYTLEE